ncbi:MAG: peptide chain release factor N(5)-glutamine methyltransferase [Rhizobiaceae bacterium]
MLTLAALHFQARRLLLEAGLPTPDLDARLLIEDATGTSHADVITNPGKEVGGLQAAALEAALARRLAGEPVHRILGWREFYGLRLCLSKETLEPRPDTETLVDAALPRLRDIAAREGGCHILDLGTGTGAVALALLSEVPLATAMATDVSEDALSTAATNARANGLADRFQALQSDWFAEVEGRFHAILSNPPYISVADHAALDRSTKDFDPARALIGGEDGLDAYRAIATGAAGHLVEGGFVAVEIGHDQRESAAAVFEAEGWRLRGAKRDLGGNDRVLIFERPGAECRNAK